MSGLSVVIPTLNEEATLPGLLDALGAQSRPPDEIIVADAGSTDGTPELARARGARLVRGGRPGPGRNAGARAAVGDLLLFLCANGRSGSVIRRGGQSSVAQRNRRTRILSLTL